MIVYFLQVCKLHLLGFKNTSNNRIAIRNFVFLPNQDKVLSYPWLSIELNILQKNQFLLSIKRKLVR